MRSPLIWKCRFSILLSRTKNRWYWLMKGLVNTIGKVTPPIVKFQEFPMLFLRWIATMSAQHLYVWVEIYISRIQSQGKVLIRLAGVLLDCWLDISLWWMVFQSMVHPQDFHFQGKIFWTTNTAQITLSNYMNAKRSTNHAVKLHAIFDLYITECNMQAYITMEESHSS